MPEYTAISTGNHECSPQLNVDVISHIFSLNADMEHETEQEKCPALVTLRHSSQVCADWRQVAIGSPLLWAQVLNLNFLSQRTDQWMKEVVRRTGTALLHIKSIDYDYDVWPSAVYSIQWLLTEHWKRIRSLDLQLSAHFDEDEHMWHQWRRIFQRPSPSLEVFRFSWSDGSECFSPSTFSLFSHDAPSLRTLSVSNMPVDFELLSAPNLRNLVLHSTVTAFDLLRALEEMPLLETLEMKTHFPFEDTQRSFPQVVALPRLTTLKFTEILSSLNTALEFLACIIPGDGCTLDFAGIHTPESPGENSKDLYGKILSRYSQSCTELQTATNLEATIFSVFFSLSVNLSPNRRFSFGINGKRSQTGTVSTILSSFTGMRLDTVNMLTLYLANAPPVHWNQPVTKFLQALNSVEELATDCQTLNFLQDVQRRTKVITFPALKIVNIHLDRISESYWLSPVVDFFNTRLDLGIPLATLMLKMRGPPTADVENLKNVVPGLAVQITSYSE